jgi:hypothetical protein
MKGETLLLHFCCGVCGAGALEKLKKENFQITAFFYNPNIYPAEEYFKRWEVAIRVAEIFKIKLYQGAYEPTAWFKQINGLEKEPEGGKRCEVCFKIRLKATYQKMKELQLALFATTLTLSPHKPSAVINRVGEEVGGRHFLKQDFKKQAGFEKAIFLARKYHLYRQNYCGCRFSFR